MKLSVFLKMFSAKAEQLVIWNEEKSLEAVKQNGDALRYVKEQTETVCLEAVKQNGYALQYVNANVFEIDVDLK